MAEVETAPNPPANADTKTPSLSIKMVDTEESPISSTISGTEPTNDTWTLEVPHTDEPTVGPSIPWIKDIPVYFPRPYSYTCYACGAWINTIFGIGEKWIVDADFPHDRYHPACLIEEINAHSRNQFTAWDLSEWTSDDELLEDNNVGPVFFGRAYYQHYSWEEMARKQGLEEESLREENLRDEMLRQVDFLPGAVQQLGVELGSLGPEDLGEEDLREEMWLSEEDLRQRPFRQQILGPEALTQEAPREENPREENSREEVLRQAKLRQAELEKWLSEDLPSKMLPDEDNFGEGAVPSEFAISLKDDEKDEDAAKGEVKAKTETKETDCRDPVSSSDTAEEQKKGEGSGASSPS